MGFLLLIGQHRRRHARKNKILTSTNNYHLDMLLCLKCLFYLFNRLNNNVESKLIHSFIKIYILLIYQAIINLDDLG